MYFAISAALVSAEIWLIVIVIKSPPCLVSAYKFQAKILNNPKPKNSSIIETTTMNIKFLILKMPKISCIIEKAAIARITGNTRARTAVRLNVATTAVPIRKAMPATTREIMNRINFPTNILLWNLD